VLGSGAAHSPLVLGSRPTGHPCPGGRAGHPVHAPSSSPLRSARKLRKSLRPDAGELKASTAPRSRREATAEAAEGEAGRPERDATGARRGSEEDPVNLPPAERVRHGRRTLDFLREAGQRERRKSRPARPGRDASSGGRARAEAAFARARSRGVDRGAPASAQRKRVGVGANRAPQLFSLWRPGWRGRARAMPRAGLCRWWSSAARR